LIFELALFQRKKGDLGAGHWEVPGGKVEKGESSEQALKREIMEELELSVQVNEWLGKSSHDFGTRIIGLDAYWVTPSHFNWTLNDHDDAVWVDQTNWHKWNIAVVDIPLIEKAFQIQRPRP
jgi:mutator protein MutT